MNKDSKTVIIKPRRKPGPIALAIANYINRKAELVRSFRQCGHDWSVVSEAHAFTKENPDYKWKEITYVCRKCRDVRHVNTKQQH